MREAARKVAYVVTIIVLIPVVFLSGTFAMWLLTTTNTASVSVSNRSQRTLENVVLAVPGRSAKFGSLEPGDSAGFAADARLSLHVRVSFDADGQHYELHREAHILPVGDTIVSASVDPALVLSLEAKPTFMF